MALPKPYWKPISPDGPWPHPAFLETDAWSQVTNVVMVIVAVGTFVAFFLSIIAPPVQRFVPWL